MGSERCSSHLPNQLQGTAGDGLWENVVQLAVVKHPLVEKAVTAVTELVLMDGGGLPLTGIHSQNPQLGGTG